MAGLSTAYAQSGDDDILQKWIDYVESYKQYMKDYKVLAHERFYEYRVEIKELKSFNSNLSNSILDKENEIIKVTDQQNRLGTIESGILNNIKIQKMQDTIDQQEKKIGYLTNKTTAYESEINYLKQLDQSSKRVHHDYEDVVWNTSAYDKLQKENTKLQNQIYKLNDHNSKSYNDLENEVIKQGQQIDRMKIEISDKENKISKLNRDISNLQSKVSSLEKDKKNLQRDLAEAIEYIPTVQPTTQREPQLTIHELPYNFNSNHMANYSNDCTIQLVGFYYYEDYTSTFKIYYPQFKATNNGIDETMCTFASSSYSESYKDKIILGSLTAHTTSGLELFSALGTYTSKGTHDEIYPSDSVFWSGSSFKVRHNDSVEKIVLSFNQQGNYSTIETEFKIVERQ